MTNIQPTPAGTVVKVVSDTSRSEWKITSIDALDTRPHLKADYLKRGFDGHIYTAERVIEGTRKKAKTAYLLKANSSRQDFYSMW